MRNSKKAIKPSTERDVCLTGLRKENMSIRLREEVRKFAEAMELNLRDNERRGGWENETYEYLFAMAKDNIRIAEDIKSSGFIKDKQCVDAANFLMMIRDNSIRRFKKGTKHAPKKTKV